VLKQRYLPDMQEHSLRREIIATQLAKKVTDHMGINFVGRLQRETGASVAFIMRAFVIAESIYHLDELWGQIELLDYKVKPGIQQKMMLQLYNLIRRATRWFLRARKPTLHIEETIQAFKAPIAELIQQLPTLLTEEESFALTTEMAHFIEEGVPETLARHIASCNTLFTSLDIVEATLKHQHISISDMAKMYYALGARFELNGLREQMNSYPVDNQWDELARSAFRDDLDRAQRKLSISALTFKAKKAQEKTLEERIDVWLKKHHCLMERWQILLAEMKASPAVGFITYSVVLRELFDFAEAG
jgi:glutamate dehydrogenase